MRTDERGALQPATPVQYRTYLAPGGVRYQAEPPVCNDCGHEITRQNFGWACLTSAADAREQVEWIACTACTNIRQVGPPLRHFIALHHL
jgi:hypothetical protein